MDKKSASDALRALTKRGPDRSDAARLRALIEEVEAALAAGIRRATVLETLREHGISMTLKSFEGTLYRIRKERRKMQNSRKKEPTRPTAPSQREVTRPKPKRFVHDPFPDNDLLKKD